MEMLDYPVLIKNYTAGAQVPIDLNLSQRFTNNASQYCTITSTELF
jgi:hypothetical protein